MALGKRYQRVLAGTTAALDTPGMADLLPMILVLMALLDGTALYGLLVVRRRHQRRLDQRLQDSAHLYGLVRVMLSDRRAA